MITIKNKDGVILDTKGKYCGQNIPIAIDSTNLEAKNIAAGVEILGVVGTFEGEIPEGYILPSGNFEITTNGNYDISEKETVSVNVPTGGGGGDSLWAETMNRRLNAPMPDLAHLFRGDYTLVDATPYFAGFDTSNNVTTEFMFDTCSSLTTVPLFDTSNVANMGYMFYYCGNLTTIPQFDTSNVTNMSHMFESSGVSTIPLLNTSNVREMVHMFTNSRITTLPQLDTHNVTNMDSMFNNAQKLTSLPALDTSNVTNMTNMFNGCNQLTSVAALDTSNVTNMRYMFYGCYKLTSVPQLDTSKVTNMGYMFQDCLKLEEVDITSMDKVSSTNYGNYIFAFCYSLKKVVIRNMTVTPKLGSVAFSDCYHFFGTVNAEYNPDGLADGYVYVPDDKVETLKSATNWSKIATQIKPLSELEE